MSLSNGLAASSAPLPEESLWSGAGEIAPGYRRDTGAPSHRGPPPGAPERRWGLDGRYVSRETPCAALDLSPSMPTSRSQAQELARWG